MKLSDIRIDGGTQSRVSISEQAVADYAEAMTEGATLPPVVVFFDGTDYWLADGFHRYMATKRIGALEIDADVQSGTQKDALLYAYGANQSHGLRRTNDDKRKAVVGVLGLMPEWSDRAIARHVGVSAPFVAAVRSPDAADRQAEHRATSAAKKGVTHHDADAGCNPITPQSSPIPAVEHPAKAADREPGPVSIDDADAPSLHDLIDDVQRENKVLQAQVEAMTSDDTAARLASYVRMYEDAVRKQSEEMDKTKRAADREAWTKRQLMRCGKAVGEEDPTKIASAVEAMARSSKKVGV